MSPPRIVTLEIAETMAALSADGLTQEAISDIVGFAQSTIQRTLRKLRAGYRFEPAQPPPPYCPTDDSDDQAHIDRVLTVRPRGFPDMASRPHSRRAA